jgi:hypothetical protein
MPEVSRIVSVGPSPETVRSEIGEVLRVPEGWTLVPPGDPGLTRRLKAAGATWTVQEKKGRKVFSRGVWVARETVAAVQSELVKERGEPAYQKKQVAAARRRERDQSDYVQAFQQAVLEFLAFAPCYSPLAERMAQAVTAHATPVGSGTVARTERIPIEARAEAAVIAWMRHQTTAYDHMVIPRVKGQRREVRRRLAGQSALLLTHYRSGIAIFDNCPLQLALRQMGCLDDKPAMRP